MKNPITSIINALSKLFSCYHCSFRSSCCKASIDFDNNDRENVQNRKEKSNNVEELPNNQNDHQTPGERYLIL